MKKLELFGAWETLFHICNNGNELVYQSNIGNFHKSDCVSLIDVFFNK